MEVVESLHFSKTNVGYEQDDAREQQSNTAQQKPAGFEPGCTNCTHYPVGSKEFYKIFPEYVQYHRIARAIERNLHQAPVTKQVMDYVRNLQRCGYDQIDFLGEGTYGHYREGTFRLFFWDGLVRFRPDEDKIIGVMSGKAIREILKLQPSNVCLKADNKLVSKIPTNPEYSMPSPFLRGVGIIPGLSGVLQVIKDTVVADLDQHPRTKERYTKLR